MKESNTNTPPDTRIYLELSPYELDTICAALGKYKKKISDRIKCGRRAIGRLGDSSEDARIAGALTRHIIHNTRRLEEVDGLLSTLNEINASVQ